jgi:hypothetical protein
MAYVYTYGDGSPENPYQVWTADDLNGVRDYLSSCFIQKADISLADIANWVPLCWDDITGYYLGEDFSGTYNGDNFIISDVYCDRTTQLEYSYASIFGYTFGATLTNIIIKGYFKGQYYTGALVGRVEGGSEHATKTYITNCHAEAEIIGSESGGLIGDCNCAEIKQCSAVCEISGTSWLGGLVGAFNFGTIENCFSRSIVTGTGNTIGGLIGYTGGIATTGPDPWTYPPEVLKCYSASVVSGDTKVKGLIGDPGGVTYRMGYPDETEQPVTVEDCYYDSDLIPGIDDDNATPKTTEEMKNTNTFIDWNFSTIWDISGKPWNRLPATFHKKDGVMKRVII